LLDSRYILRHKKGGLPMRGLIRLLILLLVAVVSSTVGQQANSASTGGASTTFALTSSAFAAGAEIPRQYTCKGADTSPALAWSGAPAQSASFALIVDDPDAPHGTWVHWVLWNLPASAHALPQGVAKRDQLDDGSRQGRNSDGKTGYSGPCPPGGQTHRYFFRFYALDGKLDLAPGAGRGDLDGAMKGHVLAQTEYMGTFHK
jgi:Raf kinase inhibitor-like YbhB/YbcL family protein